MKQRRWWEENYPDGLYRNDWLIALATHAMSWSFMIHLPVAWLYGFQPAWAFFASFAANAVCHAFVDDLKANRLRIGLVTDQLCHLVQILSTWCFLVLFHGA